MSEEKCPKCGAEYRRQAYSSGTNHLNTSYAEWECGSYNALGGFKESPPCLRRQLTAAQSKLEEQAREIERLRETINGFCGYVVTCRKSNTREWMEGLVIYVNDVCEAIGDPDRFVLNWQLDIFKQRTEPKE